MALMTGAASHCSQRLAAGQAAEYTEAAASLPVISDTCNDPSQPQTCGAAIHAIGSDVLRASPQANRDFSAEVPESEKRCRLIIAEKTLMIFPLKLAIGIATSGRPAVLTETLRILSDQTRAPDAIFICPASDDDIDAARIAELSYPHQIVRGKPGLCAQRNAILDVARNFDVLVFLDDDFFATRGFLHEVELCFAAQPETVAVSGNVLANGVTGPGIDVAAAKAILDAAEARPPTPAFEDQYNAYGCNMALRLEPIRALGLRFDEALPLYGWLEDVDFCRRLARCGRIVKSSRMTGVHLGHKGGRTAGSRLGYSQIANPIYLWRKGTLEPKRALSQMARNVVANFSKAVAPEPWVDRRGRARGNALAMLDFARGRLHPLRILELS